MTNLFYGDKKSGPEMGKWVLIIDDGYNRVKSKVGRQPFDEDDNPGLSQNDIKIFADKISDNLVKLVEEQLKENLKHAQEV